MVTFWLYSRDRYRRRRYMPIAAAAASITQNRMCHKRRLTLAIESSRDACIAAAGSSSTAFLSREILAITASIRRRSSASIRTKLYETFRGVRISGLAFATRNLPRSAAGVHTDLQRGLTSLASIASTAPLLGLFATVLGIVCAFLG